MKEKLYKIDGIEVLVKRLNSPMSWFALAMTWNRQIYHRDLWNIKDKDIRHEMGHIVQQTYWGWKFYPIYLWQWIKRFSYKRIPFEKECFTIENEYRGWFLISKYSWTNYDKR